MLARNRGWRETGDRETGDAKPGAKPGTYHD